MKLTKQGRAKLEARLTRLRVTLQEIVDAETGTFHEEAVRQAKPVSMGGLVPDSVSRNQDPRLRMPGQPSFTEQPLLYQWLDNREAMLLPATNVGGVVTGGWGNLPYMDALVQMWHHTDAKNQTRGGTTYRGVTPIWRMYEHGMSAFTLVPKWGGRQWLHWHLSSKGYPTAEDRGQFAKIEKHFGYPSLGIVYNALAAQFAMPEWLPKIAAAISRTWTARVNPEALAQTWRAKEV